VGCKKIKEKLPMRENSGKILRPPASPLNKGSKSFESLNFNKRIFLKKFGP
jgi:hypothetical protein